MNDRRGEGVRKKGGFRERRGRMRGRGEGGKGGEKQGGFG